MAEKLSVLRRENDGGVKEAGPLLTAPRLWAEIIEDHTEILQVGIVSYPGARHGEQSGDYYCEFVPVGNLDTTLTRGDWPRRLPVKEIVAVGAVVDVCNEDGCRHSSKDHQDKELQIWEWWHDGLSLPWGESLSFVFLDIEWYGPTALAKVLEVLGEVGVDWYALDSGGGYHIIIDELVPLADLPERYGGIIAHFGDRLDNFQLKGWGDDLVRNGGSQRKVISWCEDVFKNCGHVDEPIDRQTHIIDLRHIAHSLQRATSYHSWLDQNPFNPRKRRPSPGVRMGGPYLRISPGKGCSSPPMLVAKQSSGELALFASGERSLFRRPGIQKALF